MQSSELTSSPQSPNINSIRLDPSLEFLRRVEASKESTVTSCRISSNTTGQCSSRNSLVEQSLPNHNTFGQPNSQPLPVAERQENPLREVSNFHDQFNHEDSATTSGLMLAKRARREEDGMRSMKPKNRLDFDRDDWVDGRLRILTKERPDLEEKSGQNKADLAN
ncbi:hypothetical protein MKX03_029539 [Papaver bracteatum]|nr:hypothetical protein MKX03_029539 [Papaver bracteatum]